MPFCSGQMIDIIVGLRLWAALTQDIRYALRLGRKSPAFFACDLLLALGIGLNSAVFSLLDALLLRPLPVRKPGELVRLVQVAAPLGPRSFFTYNTYRALSQRNKGFTALFAYNKSNVAVRDNVGAHSVRCHIVSGSFFSALGVQPLYGRTLSEMRSSGSTRTRRAKPFANRPVAASRIPSVPSRRSPAVCASCSFPPICAHCRASMPPRESLYISRNRIALLERLFDLTAVEPIECTRLHLWRRAADRSTAGSTIVDTAHSRSSQANRGYLLR